MIFHNKKDYLCYVQAVHLLQFESIKQDCDFRHNDTLYKPARHDLTPPRNAVLLNHEMRAKEYFYIIDNTEWPEALDDPLWEKAEVPPADGSKDVFLELNTVTTFRANNKYIFWTFIFTIVLVLLSLSFLLAGACYVRQSWKYNMYQKERRTAKLLMLKVKDSEYTNFLL